MQTDGTAEPVSKQWDPGTFTSEFVSGHQPNGMSVYKHAILGLFPARVSRHGEAQGHCHGMAAHPGGTSFTAWMWQQRLT